MEKVNKHSVLKAVREKGSWKGYIAPNKVNAFHIKDGWHIGMDLVIRWDEYSNIYYAFFGEGTEGPFLTRKLDDVLEEFLYYNCNNELGTRISFWTE